METSTEKNHLKKTSEPLNKIVISRLVQSAMNLDNNFNSTISIETNSDSRSVRFLPEVTCVIIETREDYECLGISKDIWYDKDDYLVFHNSAVTELKAYMALYSVDLKTAMKKCYDENPYLSYCSCSSPTTDKIYNNYTTTAANHYHMNVTKDFLGSQLFKSTSFPSFTPSNLFLSIYSQIINLSTKSTHSYQPFTSLPPSHSFSFSSTTYISSDDKTESVLEPNIHLII